MVAHANFVFRSSLSYLNPNPKTLPALSLQIGCVRRSASSDIHFLPFAFHLPFAYSVPQTVGKIETTPTQNISQQLRTTNTGRTSCRDVSTLTLYLRASGAVHLMGNFPPSWGTNNPALRARPRSEICTCEWQLEGSTVQIHVHAQEAPPHDLPPPIYSTLHKRVQKAGRLKSLVRDC